MATWLHRIVVNTALMKLRTRRRRPEESLEPLLPTFLADGHHAERFSGSELQPDLLMARESMRAAVRACIDRLPERHRAVLVLRDVEELENGEVATLLGITPNAAKIRLHRARQALATLLRAAVASRNLEAADTRAAAPLAAETPPRVRASKQRASRPAAAVGSPV